MIRASSNFNETHMKNSLLWINEWWWLIEERFCEEVKTQIQLKIFLLCSACARWWRFFPRKILLRPCSCYKLKEIFMDKKFLLQITGCVFWKQDFLDRLIDWKSRINLMTTWGWTLFLFMIRFLWLIFHIKKMFETPLMTLA